VDPDAKPIALVGDKTAISEMRLHVNDCGGTTTLAISAD